MKTLNFKAPGFWKKLSSLCSAETRSPEISQTVSRVIADVRARGDSALFELTKKFDGADIDKKNIRVSRVEISQALKKVSPADKKMMRSAIRCVKEYNARSKPKNWKSTNPHGAIVGEIFYPIRRVGLYIPGGNAPLVSTVAMTATLAKIAGCPEICVCTPPSKDGSVNPFILSALSILGIDEIYKAGGAQAIAAMGIGTQSIPAVDKLFGPGNAFVIEAKRQLFGEVGCDLLPGPSEIMIIADSTAPSGYAAADLLSQAEHGSGRERIFIASTSGKLLSELESELKKQAEKLSRREKLLKIIADRCVAVSVPDLDSAAEIANYIAPEHIELMVANPDSLAQKISTSGAILLGMNSPTVLGDFTAGPSHTLPTGRTGRFSGGLQVVDFMRRSSYVKYSKKSIVAAKPAVEAFSAMEMLDAHANSLLQRLQK